MSPILYLPSQVMTSEQAVSRVQDLIDNYRRHTEDVPSSTLPTAMRLIIRQAFEELAHWTMRIEIYLPQLPMFFPDDIVRQIIIIVVLVHEQRDLLAHPYHTPDAAQYILSRSQISFMTTYLMQLHHNLARARNWLASKEAEHHKHRVNSAILRMHESLCTFTHEDSVTCGEYSSAQCFHCPASLRSSIPSVDALIPDCNYCRRHGLSPSEMHRDFGELGADHLGFLLRNFYPLSLSWKDLPHYRSWRGPNAQRQSNRSHSSGSSSPLCQFLRTVDHLIPVCIGVPRHTFNARWRRAPSDTPSSLSGSDTVFGTGSDRSSQRARRPSLRLDTSCSPNASASRKRHRANDPNLHPWSPAATSAPVAKRARRFSPSLMRSVPRRTIRRTAFFPPPFCAIGRPQTPHRDDADIETDSGFDEGSTTGISLSSCISSSPSLSTASSISSSSSVTAYDSDSDGRCAYVPDLDINDGKKYTSESVMEIDDGEPPANVQRPRRSSWLDALLSLFSLRR